MGKTKISRSNIWDSSKQLERRKKTNLLVGNPLQSSRLQDKAPLCSHEYVSTATIQPSSSLIWIGTIIDFSNGKSPWIPISSPSCSNTILKDENEETLISPWREHFRSLDCIDDNRGGVFSQIWRENSIRDFDQIFSVQGLSEDFSIEDYNLFFIPKNILIGLPFS